MSGVYPAVEEWGGITDPDLLKGKHWRSQIQDMLLYGYKAAVVCWELQLHPLLIFILQARTHCSSTFPYPKYLDSTI